MIKKLKVPFVYNGKLCVYVESGITEKQTTRRDSGISYYTLYDKNKKPITSLVGTVNPNAVL